MQRTLIVLMIIAVAFSTCNAVPRRGKKKAKREEETCENSCKCQDGGPSDGGKPVNSEGYCEYYCSLGGNCGNGNAYLSGLDCTSCKKQDATTAPPPPPTTPAPAPPTTPTPDVHNQCDNLKSWCANFDKETDCCSSTIQEKCPSLCHTCPARHCEWNDWVEGECSATCGVGTRDNNRTKSVVEANGGTCTGQPTETVECKIIECPIPCEWSEWTIGDCSKSCGGGMHTKTRTETVEAQHGGEECNAEHSTIEESCNTEECPVHCEWSTWTIGQCSKTCGGGQRTDTRLKHVEKQFGGDECPGDSSAQVSCNTDECAVCRTKDDKDSDTGMPPNPNVPCHFPFNWNGKTYDECTMDDHDQKWCGTHANVVENATSLLEYGVTEGWGHCEESEICGHVEVDPIISSTRSGTYEVGELAKNGKVWTDRGYKFTALADELVGGVLFSGPHRAPAGSVLTLNGGQPGTMYAFLSKGRDGGFKSSLLSNGWESTPLEAKWDHVGMDVFKKVSSSETLPASQGCCDVFGFVPLAA